MKSFKNLGFKSGTRTEKLTKPVKKSNPFAAFAEEDEDVEQSTNNSSHPAEKDKLKPTVQVTPLGSLQEAGQENLGGQRLGAGAWSTMNRRAKRTAMSALPPNFKPQVAAPSTLDHKTDGNWRDRSAATVAARNARYEAATTIRGGKNGGTARMTHTPGPRTKSNVLYANQRPGVLVWHWDLREWPDSWTPSEKYAWYGPDGKKYYRRGRYWIIIAVSDFDVWEIPIYTNNDRGLKGTPRNRWIEYHSLRQSHVNAATFKNQSPENQILEIDWMEDEHLKITNMRTTMCAHWTEMKKRSIDEDELRVVGALSKKETDWVCPKVLKRAGVLR